MANREHLEILESGALEWNAWRREYPRVRPDLRQAHLADANLRGFDFREADLRGASLLGANVSGADLRGANLSECDLRFCDWRRARLSGAKLRDAKGATERMLVTAGRAEWRARLPPVRAAQAGAVIAALALAWTFAAHGLPSFWPPEAGSEPMIEAAAAVIEAGQGQWSIEGVAISGGRMRVRLSVDEITDDAYLDTLDSACHAIDGRLLAPPVNLVEVLRRDGGAGWVFEDAARCGEVLRSPRERRVVIVAAGSRPISASASSRDER